MLKTRWQVLILILCFTLMVAQVVAQDSPPAPEETPSSVVPEETPLAPTDTPVEPPVVEVTSEPTVEPPVDVTAEPPAPPTAPPEEPGLPAEPELALLVREMFDSGDLSGWVYGPNWIPVANESGFGLQVANTADVLQLQRGPFINAAAQVSVNFTGGSVHLSLRQSEVGSYSAALDASGFVTLYRAGVPAVSAPVILPPAQWQTLRLSVMDGVLRIAVNDVELIAWQDVAPLPPGLAAVTVYPPADGTPFTVQIDNLFLWVPETDVALYPPPTPTPPPVEPTTPPPVVVTEEPPVETAEPPAEVTTEPTDDSAPEVVIEVTAEATIEPTADVTAEPTPERTPVVDPATGKSLVYQAYIPPPDAQATASDLPDASVPFIVPPYFESGNTVGNTLTNEANLVLTCGFNITATTWYRFTPGVTRQYVMNTAGSAFDTILAVYPNNGTVPANNPVGCNDDVSTTDRTSRLAITLTAGQTYWIRLGGYNGEAGNFNFALDDPAQPAPAAPKLFAPVNGASTSDTSPEFQWLPPTTGAVPAHYEIQIGTTSTLTALLHSAIVNAPTTTYNGYTFPGDGVYYWRVRSLKASRVGGAWSGAFKVTIDTIKPPAPVLNAPLNTITLTANRPALSWKASAGATRYRVSLTEDGSATSLLLPGKDVVTGTSLSLAATVMAQPLQHGKTYAWSVVALDAALNESDSSPVWKFSVNLMNAPADGIAVVAPVAARPTFTWYPAGFVGVQYVLEVDDENTFADPLRYQSPLLTTTSHPLPVGAELPTGATYFWRVRVLNHALPVPAAVPVRSFVVTPAASPPVTLLTPTNASVVKDDPVIFTWRAVAATAPNQPYTYQIQIAKNRTFATDIVDDQTTAAGVTTANNALPEEGVYFWRVRALNNVGAPGAWSAVWSLTVDRTALAAPFLKAPLDGSTTNLVRPTLSWNAVTGAVAYYVTLTEDGNPTPLFVDRKVTGTSLALTAAVLPTPLKHGAVYEWWVKSEDKALNVSGNSQMWAFIVNLMKTPANGAGIRTVLPARPVFTWATAGLPVTPPVVYKLTVGKDHLFAVSKEYTTSAMTFTPPLGETFFNTPGTYYWKLQVNGEPANPPVWTFVLSTTLPAAPTLVSPATNTSFNVLPTLKWNSPAGGPFSYEIQVATNNTFTSLIAGAPFVVPVNTTSFDALPALDDGTYWWRVRALNADLAPGPWSASRSFIYDTDAPTNVPVLLTPANGAIFTGPLPRFTWRAVSGFTRYEIQLITTGNFTSPPALGFVVASTGFTPPGPLMYTGYRWRVRVLDAAGNGGPWSDPFELKVVSAASAVPVLNRFTTNTPTLTWTPISWATAYEVQISYNSTFTNLLPAIAPITPPTTSYTTAPLANGTYYWRVRARRQDNTTWGAWSTGGTGSFQVDVP